jgi:hypothetical protein
MAPPLVQDGGVAAQTSIDYARQALDKTDGNERRAVVLLVQWCRAQSQVLEAFYPRDDLEKRARQAVRKVKREAG